MGELFFMKEESETKGKIAYEALKDIEPGKLLTYPKLLELTGYDFQGKSRTCIVRSVNRHMLQNDKKMLINVRGIGYKIGLPDEQVSHGKFRKIRAGRQVKSGMQELLNVDTKNMSADERQRLNDLTNHMTTLLRYLRTRTIKGIDKTAQAVDVQKENLKQIEKFERQLADFKSKLLVKV